MIMLNMYGVEVSLSKGATLAILPYNSEHNDDIVTVVVETIRFEVSREMLLQENDPVLRGNFFATALSNVEGKKVIEILPGTDVAQFICAARLYPIIFDFLARRIDDEDARVHVHKLDRDSTMELTELEGFLFPGLISLHLPTVGNSGDRVNIAIPPSHPWKDVRKEQPYTTEMCMDAEFVRLVKRCKTGDGGENLAVAEAEKIINEEVNKPLIKKYNLEPRHIMGAYLYDVDCNEAVVLTVETNGIDSLRSIRLHDTHEGVLP